MEPSGEPATFHSSSLSDTIAQGTAGRKGEFSGTAVADRFDTSGRTGPIGIDKNRTCPYIIRVPDKAIRHCILASGGTKFLIRPNLEL